MHQSIKNKKDNATKICLFVKIIYNTILGADILNDPTKIR